MVEEEVIGEIIFAAANSERALRGQACGYYAFHVIEAFQAAGLTSNDGASHECVSDFGRLLIVSP